MNYDLHECLVDNTVLDHAPRNTKNHTTDQALCLVRYKFCRLRSQPQSDAHPQLLVVVKELCCYPVLHSWKQVKITRCKIGSIGRMSEKPPN
ncbi:hypothetical protein TNCV_4374881 [Trichonephila clavipes]|uniref:Uncharacterized protein n=1 Tax=Trichonephila clavipes TaxID=2585209 RepID=A0A8X6W2A2_TRICX|nr:hypothetical protein TNCV_4374881 [Trichonephila clavipes]